MQIGQALRLKTGEYGVVSQRPRRIGAFDTVQFRAAATDVHHVQEVVLSKMDCLNLFYRTRDKKIPVVTGYQLDGQTIDYVPTTEQSLRQVTPKYEYFDAFDSNISGFRHANQLPPNAQTFIKELEKRIDRQISIVGVGPDREQVIHL